MKRLLTLFAISTLLFSCEKENITPSLENEEIYSYNSSSQENSIELKFIITPEDNFDGSMDFYIGNNLDSTIDLSTVAFIDTTLFDGGEPVKLGIIKLGCTNLERTQCGGWFHIVAQFNDTINFVFNENKFNGSTTFVNDNTDFLEPSFKLGENVIEFYNSFWVKPINVTPTAPKETYKL
jgi:hypothetical protein